MEGSEYEGSEYEEEYEVEEVADDTPMRIHSRVFLGSIDAARNREALARSSIGATMALLGGDDERVETDGGDDGVVRVLVRMEDSLDEPLFVRLPQLLVMLQTTIANAERRDCNVLVHCMAGRSRSPSLVAAWLITTQKFTLDEAIERIKMIRPWVEINARFMQDLKLFEHVHRFDTSIVNANIAWQPELSCYQSLLPRLDFGLSLVADILAHKKTITMRLVSDVENDANSDLGQIVQHSTVVATTESSQNEKAREAFAFLRIDHVDSAVTLATIDETTLRKTGFTSKTEVLTILKTFYPDIHVETPLLLVSFTRICRSE